MSLPSSANQPVQKPGPNVYTMMLIVSFLALFTACALLWFELHQFGWPTTVPWAAGGGS